MPTGHTSLSLQSQAARRGGVEKMVGVCVSHIYVPVYVYVFMTMYIECTFVLLLSHS